MEELAHVAESGGAAPTVRRLGSLLTPRQMQQFGAFLRDRRNQAGLSRVQLGRKAQLSDATVKFLETARHPPSRATVLRLIAVPELKLSWADVPGALSPPRQPTSDAPAHALLAALHQLDPRLTAETVCELSVLADELQRFYGCRAGAELAAQLAHNAALPPSPYSHGVAAVLLWALGLGPCPGEPAAPFSEAYAQRLAARLPRSGAQPAARERALGIGQATAWLLDEQASAPSHTGPGLAHEPSLPPHPLPAERPKAPHS